MGLVSGSSGNSNSQTSSPSLSSFSLRRSQSQKPSLNQPTFGLGKPSNFNNQFTAHLRTNEIKHQNNNDQDDDEDNDMHQATKSIKSLPPLRSTSYLNRINNGDPSSEPILSNGKTLIAKPSQLVKPIVNTTDMGNRTQAARFNPSVPTKQSFPSRMPTTKQPAVVSVDKMGGSIATISRRLSLQHTGYNSLSLKMNEPTNEQDKLDNDQEFSDQEDDEDTSGSDDDDATTATTMTQTSDSNVQSISKVNSEFNSMIQMLSSSAILGESDINVESSLFTSYENDFKRKRNNSAREEASESSFISATKQLPRVKSTISQTMGNNVIKSQSINFGARNQSLKKTTQPAINTALNSKKQTKNELKLQRPRSRIIFDPTNSQFHVSCTAEDAYQDDEDDNDDDDDDEEEEFSEDDTSSEIEDDQLQDDTSLKLLDAKNKMIGKLKCLPSAQDNDGEGDTIRRLKDYRGSLESLRLIRAEPVRQAPNSNDETPPPPYGSLVKPQQNNCLPPRSKSPAGFALKSLFGLHQNNQQQQKTATVVRHSSLRSSNSGASLIKFNDDYTSKAATKSVGQTNKESPFNNKQNIGSELLQKASKKLSASSSSLTSKFKFISSGSKQQSPIEDSNTSSPKDGRPSLKYDPSSFGGKTTLAYNQAQKVSATNLVSGDKLLAQKCLSLPNFCTLLSGCPQNMNMFARCVCDLDRRELTGQQVPVFLTSSRLYGVFGRPT